MQKAQADGIRCHLHIGPIVFTNSVPQTLPKVQGDPMNDLGSIPPH